MSERLPRSRGEYRVNLRRDLFGVGSDLPSMVAMLRQHGVTEAPEPDWRGEPSITPEAAARYTDNRARAAAEAEREQAERAAAAYAERDRGRRWEHAVRHEVSRLYRNRHGYTDNRVSAAVTRALTGPVGDPDDEAAVRAAARRGVEPSPVRRALSNVAGRFGGSDEDD